MYYIYNVLQSETTENYKMFPHCSENNIILTLNRH